MRLGYLDFDEHIGNTLLGKRTETIFQIEGRVTEPLAYWNSSALSSIDWMMDL
jgi:hypothetical protein